jgi:hypothetical protein
VYRSQRRVKKKVQVVQLSNAENACLGGEENVGTSLVVMLVGEKSGL